MNEAECWAKIESLDAENLVETLDFLEHHFRDSGDYHRLFDILKMKIRRRLNLAMIPRTDEPALTPEVQNQLEDELLLACREIAELFFASDNLNDGWIYLQPVGDQELTDRLIRGVDVNEETTPAIIDVAFHQGVAPAYGYEVLLRETGTCNGITAFDVQAAQFDRTVVAKLASVLLNHFYDELLTNVRAHVAEQDAELSKAPENKRELESESLMQLLQQHSWLVVEGGHHIDATHLASVIRIARQTTHQSDHQKALELTLYGERLGSDYQFSSDPPFESIYLDHRIFYKALVETSERDVADAIAHFTAKLDSLEGDFHEGAAIEALIDLQIRTGNRDAAVETTVSRLWKLLDPADLPPSAFEIPETSTQFESMANAFRQNSNLAGFAFSRLRAVEQQIAENKKTARQN